MASGGRIANCMQSSSPYNRGFCDPWTWGSVEKTGLDGQNECQLLAESYLEEIRDWKWAIFREARHRWIRRGRGVHDCIFGVTFCKQKYLQKSMVKEWYDEKKTTLHQMGFNLMCVHNSWETREYFEQNFEVRVFIVAVNGTLFTVLHPVYQRWRLPL